MKKDCIILSLLILVSIIASTLGGMFWRSEEVHKLREVISFNNNIFLQTEAYLGQFDFNEIARKNWNQLGYKVEVKAEK